VHFSPGLSIISNHAATAIWLVLGMNEIRRRMTDELVRKPAEHLSDLFAHRDNHGGGIANDGDRHSVRFGTPETFITLSLSRSLSHNVLRAALATKSTVHTRHRTHPDQ